VNDPAAALVRRLGDKSFKVRERASRELVEMGPAAVPALRIGCKDADPEVRRRCLAILPRAMRRVVERRLEALLADKAGKPDPELPGWARFRKAVGTHEAARRLYVDMARADGELLAAAEHEPRKAGHLIAARCQALQQTAQQPGGAPLVHLAALAFTASDAKVKDEEGAGTSLCQLLESRLPEQLATDARSDCVRKLLVPFLSRCIDAGVVGPALRAAMSLKLKEAAGLAVKELRLKRGGASACAMAALAVGKLGTREHIPLLEPLLKDHDGVGGFSTGNVSGQTEVGDVALASLVRLSGHTLKEYGFPAGNLDEWVLNVHGPPILGFPGDKERNAAKRKWKAWAAKNIKKK
jgi:hypothetical protein